MPRPGDIDTTYPEKLERIGIQLLEPFKGTKIHHLMKCMSCSHEWTATPLSKLQVSWKKHKSNGCPTCETKRRNQTKAISRASNIQKLKDRGLEILSNWDGRNAIGADCIPLPVTVKNIYCGHTFTSTAVNLLRRNVECPECAKTLRTNILNAHVERVHRQWSQTATGWQKYKSEVTKLTRSNYNMYKQQINPNNLPTGKAGVDGAYHIDHIVPIRYCFNRNIPANICAHPDNLQMLGWRENVGSRDKLKENTTIPNVFKPFLSYIL